MESTAVNTQIEQEDVDQSHQQDELNADNVETNDIEETSDVETNDSEDDSVSNTDDESDDEEVTISLDEGSPPQPSKQPAPQFVKDLRRITRTQEARIRELEAQLGLVTPPAAKPVEIEKPTLESCGYDEELFEQKMEIYSDKKKEIEAAKTQKEAEEKRVADEWAAKLKDLEVKKSQLKVKDYDECEFVCQQKLSPTQQGIIVEGSENAAHIFYALGKHPEELDRISKIQNPVKFAYEVAKLETKKTITTVKRSAPPPESKVTSTSSSSLDAMEKQIIKECMVTRDFTKLFQFKQANKR